jgi:hypothetical protein
MDETKEQTSCFNNKADTAESIPPDIAMPTVFLRERLSILDVLIAEKPDLFPDLFRENPKYVVGFSLCLLISLSFEFLITHSS